MTISHSNILIPQERNITFGFKTDFMSTHESLSNVEFWKVLFQLEYMVHRWIDNILTFQTQNYYFRLIYHDVIYLMILIEN